MEYCDLYLLFAEVEAVEAVEAIKAVESVEAIEAVETVEAVKVEISQSIVIAKNSTYENKLNFY